MSTSIDYTAREYGGIDVPERLKEIRVAHDRLRAAAAEVTEERAREAVHLPGWTRGHVLIHLADLSRAFARQARYAAEGRTVEVYDGGRPTRDRRIEELHGRPAEWLREQLEEGLTAIEEAWDALGPDGWELPCAYRNSPLFATQLAWWREVELHTVDLGVGHGSEEWSNALSSHVVAFLQPRLPQGVVLNADDTGEEWSTAAGGQDLVVVRGPLRALAAWISGRPHRVLPVADGDPAAALPELNAWP
ncbi:maleylpyruvate isomerase family mycothiol-dependent enzyme [Streptomyces sp. HB2AG]|uniref:maleylpyruvate isomerase family mycothiol-dependent enzyme n=1 Tax=Streptomyces sp. HB2AG TaxID=2983400 RepID=UPI0022AADA09|nr:maleylpyruvate isomerase family mycothiol-dependent enzyme [Streptomyces sp. HB2AG]MCZ2526902.1 maleylpyruvate isomerase family mycothiol-dependent enzyme [Streptomyces sp. HB2AG]